MLVRLSLLPTGKVLNERQHPIGFNEDGDDNGLTFVVDKMIAVIYEENGVVYDVHVTSDE